VVDRLHEIARGDWKDSKELDLTDEGLLAELQKHGGEGLDELCLDPLKSAKTKQA
jgi:cardiolipin synthase